MASVDSISDLPLFAFAIPPVVDRRRLNNGYRLSSTHTDEIRMARSVSFLKVSTEIIIKKVVCSPLSRPNLLCIMAREIEESRFVNTERISPHLTAKIVRGYVQHHRLGPDQLPDLIGSVHRTLGQLGQPPEPNEVRTPAVSVRRSVHRDYVVCLDCGYRGKTLRRHIGVRHGLTGEEYRQRWGLRSNHPLTAPAYSEHRSTLAKELGLGRRSTPAVASAPTPTTLVDVASDPNPRRTRRSRRTSKSEDTASDAYQEATITCCCCAVGRADFLADRLEIRASLITLPR